MRRLLKFLLLLSGVLIVVYVLSIDSVLKKIIEQQGSRALTAQLDIERVNFHLLSSSIELYGVQATNPQAPLRNIVQLESAVIVLARSELFDRKLVAESVQLHGVRFNQPRAQSGAIAGLTPAQNNSQPQFTQAPLTQAQLTQAPLTQAQLTQVPLTQVPLTQVPSGANDNLTGALFGKQFAPLLQQLMNISAALAEDAQTTWPLLLRRVELDGQFELGTTPLRWLGSIDNITPQPRYWNTATQFEFKNAAEQSGTFNAVGTFDARKIATQSIRLSLQNVPLQHLPLSSDSPLNITIDSAVADIQGLWSRTGEQIDLNLLCHLQRAALTVGETSDPVLQAAAGIVRSATDFDIKVQASGSLRAPTVTLNSSLDPAIAKAVANHLYQQAAQSGQLPTTEMQSIQQLQTELATLPTVLAERAATLQALLAL